MAYTHPCWGIWHLYRLVGASFPVLNGPGQENLPEQSLMFCIYNFHRWRALTTRGRLHVRWQRGTGWGGSRRDWYIAAWKDCRGRCTIGRHERRSSIDLAIGEDVEDNDTLRHIRVRSLHADQTVAFCQITVRTSIARKRTLKPVSRPFSPGNTVASKVRWALFESTPGLLAVYVIA
jgi:hypothetical protein